MSSYICEIITLPARPTVCYRTTTALSDMPQVLGEAFDLLMQHLGKFGQQPAGAPYVAYFNMDMQALEIEVGFPVTHTIPGAGVVTPGEIPAGRYATLEHTGPYQTLELAYSALTEFIASQGKESTGVAYEFYKNDPSITPQEQLETQILLPLK
jgi:effector-binding domain-containing protein